MGSIQSENVVAQGTALHAAHSHDLSSVAIAGLFRGGIHTAGMGCGFRARPSRQAAQVDSGSRQQMQAYRNAGADHLRGSARPSAR